MNEAFIYDAVRTPFGRLGGGLSTVRPDDLAAHIVTELVARSPKLDPQHIDEVVFGNANGAGEENRCVARMATLLAGLPTTIPGSTVNRLCGSSMDAAFSAARQIECSEADLVLVGGVESMTRAPWVLPKPAKPFPYTDMVLVNTTLGWRLVNPKMPGEWTVSLGEATEQLREKHGITRESQDEFSVRSHKLAHAAWQAGHYRNWVSPVPWTKLDEDEGVRPETSLTVLASLKPAFRNEEQPGTITAGNASPMSDGAAGLLVGSANAAGLLARDPIARVVSRGVAATDPRDFGIAPVAAANAALQRAGLEWSQIGAVELNEAFAAQALACLQSWPVDLEIVNAWGGAIALGHPLGASGARILGTLAARLVAENRRWGVAAICIGVGQGLATVLENPAATGE